jgi:hypothetical protein
LTFLIDFLKNRKSISLNSLIQRTDLSQILWNNINRAIIQIHLSIPLSCLQIYFRIMLYEKTNIRNMNPDYKISILFLLDW